MNNNPITYELISDKFSVKYRSPSRQFGNLREELNHDVARINETYGKVYVAFSSGVDSQVMLRCFLDMKGDFESFFLHVKGLNDFEFDTVKQSEKFYGIKIKILELNIEQHKTEWLKRKDTENLPTLLNYPFEWASKQLPENFPMIMSGANEPCLIGSSFKGMHVYHNFSECLLLRFSLINKHRTILDFPYSAESLASYYCDDTIKIWNDVKEYYFNNDLISATTKKMAPGSRFNYYVKGLLKGKYFRKDILWPAKKTGYENYPNWMIPNWVYPIEHSVSVNYDELVKHLESCSGATQEFTDWNF
jgi:hypothetical protein